MTQPPESPGAVAAGRPADIGHGVGLRRDHFERILDGPTRVDWFEVISENFMVDGGRPLWILDRVRRDYPVVMHGVSLSIGSTDPLDGDYLDRLDRLARRVQPAWISDHLCWTGVGGRNAHDLLPLPYTEEALEHVVGRVRQVQERLGRRIALENVSSYLTYTASAMPEATFLSAVAEAADCGILLDVNNVYVSARNHGFDPLDYLRAVPAERVWQFHLAGHSDHGAYLLDTHDHPVPDPVWELYRGAVARFGARPTLVEWDERIPAWDVLEAESLKASRLREEVMTSGAGSEK
jgi:uncharacterized protein (UPF0276 family)